MFRMSSGAMAHRLTRPSNLSPASAEPGKRSRNHWTSEADVFVRKNPGCGGGAGGGAGTPARGEAAADGGAGDAASALSSASAAVAASGAGAPGEAMTNGTGPGRTGIAGANAGARRWHAGCAAGRPSIGAPAGGGAAAGGGGGGDGGSGAAAGGGGGWGGARRGAGTGARRGVAAAEVLSADTAASSSPSSLTLHQAGSFRRSHQSARRGCRRTLGRSRGRPLQSPWAASSAAPAPARTRGGRRPPALLVGTTSLPPRPEGSRNSCGWTAARAGRRPRPRSRRALRRASRAASSESGVAAEALMRSFCAWSSPAAAAAGMRRRSSMLL